MSRENEHQSYFMRTVELKIPDELFAAVKMVAVRMGLSDEEVMRKSIKQGLVLLSGSQPDHPSEKMKT
jgi:hypothetical protein